MMNVWMAWLQLNHPHPPATFYSWWSMNRPFGWPLSSNDGTWDQGFMRPMIRGHPVEKSTPWNTKKCDEDRTLKQLDFVFPQDFFCVLGNIWQSQCTFSPDERDHSTWLCALRQQNQSFKGAPKRRFWSEIPLFWDEVMINLNTTGVVKETWLVGSHIWG